MQVQAKQKGGAGEAFGQGPYPSCLDLTASQHQVGEVAGVSQKMTQASGALIAAREEIHT